MTRSEKKRNKRGGKQTHPSFWPKTFMNTFASWTLSRPSVLCLYIWYYHLFLLCLLCLKIIILFIMIQLMNIYNSLIRFVSYNSIWFIESVLYSFFVNSNTIIRIVVSFYSFLCDQWCLYSIWSLIHSKDINFILQMLLLKVLKQNDRNCCKLSTILGINYYKIK